MNDTITDFLIQKQVSQVGFSKAPDTPFDGLNGAISVVLHLSDAVIDQISGAPTHTYFHHYRTVNAYLDNVMLNLVLFLQNMGFDAAAVPASQSVEGLQGIFSHKKAAVRAGLGYIGKSALFISHKFGPRVRLGTVFTNAPLTLKNEKQEDRCGACGLCAANCGALAIKNIPYSEGMSREDIFDAKACSDYMKSQFKHIGRGAVCGVCMAVCPKGKK